MITCFTPMGYIRFARSLVRFCGMERDEALTLTNRFARLNFDLFRAAAPEDRQGEIRGLSLEMWHEALPYHTEIQLYRSVQTLYAMAISNHIEPESAPIVQELEQLMHNINDRFFLCYSCFIESELTTYVFCEDTLEPTLEFEYCMRTNFDYLLEETEFTEEESE